METKTLSLDDAINILHTFHPLEEGLPAHLEKIVRPGRFEKRKLLLEPPAVSRRLYFIRKGLLRSFYKKKNGEEVTNGLFTEGDFVVGVHSFYTGADSFEYIQALEPTEVLYLSKAQLDDIYGTFPEFRENGRLLTIKYLIEYSLQNQMIRTLTAQQKMKALKEKREDLLARVPQKYLASYVDMMPETFSKMKGLLKS